MLARLLTPALALVAACTPMVYTPGAHTLPMLDEPGAIAVDLSGSTSSYDASVAWSPLRHGYLHAAGSIYSDGEDSATFFRYAEAGIGGYLRIDEGLAVDLAAGHGVGTASDLAYEPQILAGDLRAIERIESGPYRRTWIQGALEWMPGADSAGSDELLTGCAIVQRWSWVSFTGLTPAARAIRRAGDGSDSAGAWTTGTPREVRGVVSEFEFVARLGTPRVMFDMRFGLATARDSIGFTPVPFTLTIGAHLRLDRIF